MTTNNLPQFQLDTDTIVSRLQKLLDQNRQAIAGLLTQSTPFTWNNLIHPWENLDDHLHHFWSPINHLNAVMNTSALRQAYNKALPLLTNYHTEIGHNQALYQAVCQIAESENYAQLDDAQKMVINHMLRDFKLAGIALPPAEKKLFADLSTDLSRLGTQFEENVLDATNGWTKHITDRDQLAGLPELEIEAAKATAKDKQLEGWLLTLEMPSYLGVMLHANSAALRQEMYTAFVTRASDQGPNAGKWDNSQVMSDILQLRRKRAQLLDFNNYAEQSLATKMVSSPAQVLEFLNHLLTATKEKAATEFQELSQFALEQGGIKKLEVWDIAYYSEKLRQKRYSISEEELRVYFPLSKVITGLFAIVGRLFDIEIKPVGHANVWHPDVTCYAIYDLEGHLRSYFYFDLYSRPNKRGGAWMDEYSRRRKISATETQLPVAYITCNFHPPAGETPSLLSHEEVTTLFHEFGHGLQHMLTQENYASVSGINGIPWDAVELCSQFLENWAWEKESIHLITEHYQTKQPLPEELLQRMHHARNFQKAMQIMRQLEFALFDFELHLNFEPDQKDQIKNILDQVRSRTAVYPVPTFNRFQHSFSHIFGGGYAAGYYSYKWAEVMACDAFGLFKEKGIFDPIVSKKFLHTFLEKGGAIDPAELFIQFRGRPPEINALLQLYGVTSPD